MKARIILSIVKILAGDFERLIHSSSETMFLLSSIAQTHFLLNGLNDYLF
jgi:hypothetical protein